MKIAMQIVLIAFTIMFFISCFSFPDDRAKREYYLTAGAVSAALFIGTSVLM